MRKSILLLSVFALAFAAPAMAGYKSAGCGLGSMIIKDDGIVQIFATTTNGTFGSQTFGITSGTSNCNGSGGYVKSDVEQEMYVRSNFDSLSQEMAQGSGEHLSALATLMGCEKPTFSASLKKNYRTIDRTSPDNMLQAVKTTVAVDPELKKACSG